MLLKFFKRGGTDDDRRTLGGSAVKNYLLGTNDQPRKKARVLLGDPDEVTEIINGLPFAKVYTSGCLSFHEDDKLTEAQKFDIMADFEAMMFVGLEPYQYTSYWVEHTDKGRVELNFVFPNVELISGNHLQVYYHNRDLNLVNSWKNLTNDKYGFINPSDLENRRDVTPSIGPNLLKDWDQSNKQKIIDKLKHYQSIEDFKQQLTDVVLTQAALRQASNNPLTCQDDIAAMLEDFGFEISRRGKDSISIKNPDPTKKNIKLKGVIYERDVTQSIISYIAQRTGPNQSANPIPAGTREDQLRTAETIFPSELEKRRERHYQRYDENLRAARAVSKQQSKLKRQSSKAASKLAQSDLSDLGERQTGLAWDVGANGSAQAADERRLSAHSNSPDGAGQSTASSHNQRDKNHPAASPTAATNPTGADGGESSSGYRSYRGQPTTEQGADWANGTQQTAPRNRDGQPIGGIDTADADSDSDELQPVPGLARDQDLGRPKSKGAKLTQSTNQSYTTSISSPSPYGYPGGVWWWYQYHSQKSKKRRVSEQRFWLSDFIYQPKPVLPSQLEKNNHATHYHPTTHYRELKQAVERFVQPSEPDAQPTQAAATADNRQDGTKTSGIDVAQLISTTVSTPRPTDTAKNPATQPANQRLLDRIRQATDRRDSNTEKRTRRISKLARQDPINLDPLGCYTNRRRKRVRKVTDRFKGFDKDITEQYIAEQQRAAKLRKLNQRAGNVKNGFSGQSERIDKVAVGFNQLHNAVKAIIELIINLLKQLFNSLSNQFSNVVKINTETKQPLSPQQKTNYVNSRPQSLGWYNELKDEVKTLPKERKNDNVPRFRMR
ncbi:relaxase/mobilization nuclease domain-containing protein [Moraxella osloensis]|uniref:relaxase/mobilization nuclease domain-containing protein n=1 Tax=Faucicola osloensis TaxID=34062 RepID=UPI0034DFACCC